MISCFNYIPAVDIWWKKKWRVFTFPSFSLNRFQIKCWRISMQIFHEPFQCSSIEPYSTFTNSSLVGVKVPCYLKLSHCMSIFSSNFIKLIHRTFQFCSECLTISNSIWNFSMASYQEHNALSLPFKANFICWYVDNCRYSFCFL